MKNIMLTDVKNIFVLLIASNLIFFCLIIICKIVQWNLPTNGNSIAKAHVDSTPNIGYSQCYC